MSGLSLFINNGLSPHKVFKLFNALCTPHNYNSIPNDKFCICFRVKRHFSFFVLYGNDDQIHRLPDPGVYQTDIGEPCSLTDTDLLKLKFCVRQQGSSIGAYF